MSTGAQVIVDELERAGVEVCFGLPGVHNLALVGGAALVVDPARRRAPRAGRGVRGGRLRAGDGTARRRADDDRAGRGEHARRGRRGLGLALADPRDRHRHPVERCGGRASTAACCTRPTGRRRCSRRWSSRCTSGLAPEDVASAAVAAIASALTAPTRPVYLEIATDLLARGGARRLAGASPRSHCPRPSSGRRSSVSTPPSVRCCGSAAARATRRRRSPRWPRSSRRRC